jgi:hypothetical protein
LQLVAIINGTPGDLGPRSISSKSLLSFYKILDRDARRKIIGLKNDLIFVKI